MTAPQIHGETGLEGHLWAEPTLATVPDHAVDLIIDLVMAAPGEITLVPTGPVTNIAMALRKEPRIASRVREVVLMGGAWSRGNQTPAAEFNTYVDPEAAAIVFGGAWPVTMIGLEVTEMAVATEDVFQRIDAIATPVAQAVSGMLRFYQAQQLREVGTAAPPVHDPCAVARVARPELVECRDAYIEVELAGRLTTGMTVTDFRAVEGRPFNARAGTSLAVGAFWDLFIDALARI